MIGKLTWSRLTVNLKAKKLRAERLKRLNQQKLVMFLLRFSNNFFLGDMR
jgi:hypothetical protein